MITINIIGKDEKEVKTCSHRVALILKNKKYKVIYTSYSKKSKKRNVNYCNFKIDIEGYKKSYIFYDKADEKELIKDNFKEYYDFHVVENGLNLKGKKVEVVNNEQKFSKTFKFSDKNNEIFAVILKGNNSETYLNSKIYTYDNVESIIEGITAEGCSDISYMKKSVRKKILRKTKKLAEDVREEKSNHIANLLESNKYFLDAKNIFIYWAMPDEVVTQKIINRWSDSKNMILPSINGDELFLKKFINTASLKFGENYDIPEPEGDETVDPESIDLVILPGVAFDLNYNRLGRGKGYYDKILKKINPEAVRIGLAYDFQIINNVPVEEHDMKLDLVISG